MVNTHPQLAVKGTAFDRTLGGLEMEFRLRDFLAGKFEVRGQWAGQDGRSLSGALTAVLQTT